MLDFALKRFRKSIPVSEYYRSLMKSILVIGFFLPFIPMILVSAVIFHQFHSAYEKTIRASLTETTWSGKRDIDRLLDENSTDLRSAATKLRIGELSDEPQSTSDAFSGLQRAKRVTYITVLLAVLLIAANAFSLSRKTVDRIEQADKKKQKMNEQMFQTGKLASIGELAAGISHEINNPVAIMVEEAGWIDDLLQEEEFKESKNLSELKRALRQIRAQGKRCKEITHKLLSFARKTDFTAQPVQLVELIEDILAISVKDKHVVVSTDIQKDLPDLNLPKTELQQVLLNLINNALYFMKDNGGTLTLSAHLLTDRLVLEVSDTGPGIPNETLPRLFDPFFTTKPVGEGTGLGLSICYGIIKKMGGEISVQSLVDRGTMFRIEIPLII